MSAETRNMLEGNLYIVSASGQATGWITASGASGVLLAYVQNFTYTSGRQIAAISDRGRAKHFKVTQYDPVAMSFTVAYGITAHYPTAITGNGSTEPMYNIEFKQVAAEQGSTASGIYLQFYGVDLPSQLFTEGSPSNTLQFQNIQALGMIGPAATGYLA
jgi:hypothetical protein